MSDAQNRRKIGSEYLCHGRLTQQNEVLESTIAFNDRIAPPLIWFTPLRYVFRNVPMMKWRKGTRFHALQAIAVRPVAYNSRLRLAWPSEPHHGPAAVRNGISPDGGKLPLWPTNRFSIIRLCCLPA